VGGLRQNSQFKRETALWPTLCDPNQLENALLNLILNSRDAMPDGGDLLIETVNAVFPGARTAGRSVPTTTVPAGEYVALLVTDTGTGMTKQVIQHAFDPFYTTKPTGEGTGLGLSMIHGFVQQSGGYVLLRSEDGRGTTVTIYLPRHLGAAGREAEPHTAADLPTSAANAVVLVIEDEAAVRMVIRDVLSDCGYTVLETGDGQSGLHILESGVRIDLLLTDVGLPGGMNGRQVADLARARRPDLKVLFLTGYVASATVGHGQMESGMEVMTKPFALDALVAKVGAMILS
jgi:CheY-like chemotaxis protein